MKEKMQESAFMIIAAVGTAKSMYLEALQIAKNGDFDKALEIMKQAEVIYQEVHSLHFDFIKAEANGDDLPFSLLLMHAEDQMMNTETIKILVEELIDLYDKKLR